MRVREFHVFPAASPEIPRGMEPPRGARTPRVLNHAAVGQNEPKSAFDGGADALRTAPPI